MSKSTATSKVTYSKPTEIATGTFAGYYTKAMTSKRSAIGKAPAKGGCFMPFAVVQAGGAITWVNQPYFTKLVKDGKAKVTPVEHFTN